MMNAADEERNMMMSSFYAAKRARLNDWLRIRRLYFQAFPQDERKPFGRIISMVRQGRSDVWCFFYQGRFAGFATTINGDGLVMIDYLAVAQPLRGQGVGTQALRTLCRAYPGQGVFVEIESPFEQTEDAAARLRRKAFYERCGFIPSRTMADVFGVRMELMCHGCSVNFDTYHTFYKTQYSAWAAEHIKPAPYPEG